MAKGPGTTRATGSGGASSARRVNVTDDYSATPTDKLRSDLETARGRLAQMQSERQQYAEQYNQTGDALYKRMAEDMATDISRLQDSMARADLELRKRNTSTKPTTSPKVNIPSMPGKYKSASVTVNGKEYSISHTPTGYGKLQQARNGRFTVRGENGYRDFSYGDSYGGYTSAREAWREVKDYLKKIR